MIYNLTNFPEITSVRSRLSMLPPMLFAILAFNFAVMFYGFPLGIQLEYGCKLSIKELLFDLFYYPLLLWGTWAVWKYNQRTKQKAIKKIVVDRYGVHYHLGNANVESLFYEDLEKSNEYGIADIDRRLGFKNRPTYMYGFKHGLPFPIYFVKPADWFTYIPKNKNQLIGHFLQGIRLSRPDLQISNTVFLDFFINPETFEFEKKSQFLFVVIISIGTLIIFALIMLLTFYLPKFKKGN